jgi:citrate synthase
MEEHSEGRSGEMIRDSDEEYYTAEEACAVLGVKPATLYSYVNRGLITSYRQTIRRQRLYRRVEVEALLRITPVEREGPGIPPAETWASEH